MIARRWHGRVPVSKAREYLKLMKQFGLRDYRSTEGNRGAWCLHRRDGDVVHVEMFTFWEDEAAIRRFAGEDSERAVVEPEARAVLAEFDDFVRHYEVQE
jgi:heme-degrading monooxygenase HmoA